MEKIFFLVQGSAIEPYEVTFVKRDGKNLSAYCTCPAGENGQICKHRINILKREYGAIVGGNVDQFESLEKWVDESELKEKLSQLSMLEDSLEQVKKDLARAKKALAKAMLD